MAEQHSSDSDFSVVRIISVLYAMTFSFVTYVCVVGWPEKGISPDWISAVLPGIVVIGAIGTAFRRRWGRLITLPVSYFMLLGVPIGTVLGFFMIQKLRKLKSEFL